MRIDKKEHQFQYVILRYMPDFARDEFVNGGILFHDAHQHRIMGRVSQNADLYRCIDREGRFMLFVESAERLIHDLQKNAEVARRGMAKNEISALVEKTFMEGIIPNAGFLGFSNIRSGVTEDIEEKFEWLYKRFVDDEVEKSKEERQTAVEIVKAVIVQMSGVLKRLPGSVFFDYSVTGGRYRFDVSFGYPDNVYLKVLGLQATKKGSVDLRNVVRVVTVLSDIKREQPGYTFGVILHVPGELKRWMAGKTLARLQTRFREADIDLVIAEFKEMEEYFREKELLR